MDNDKAIELVERQMEIDDWYSLREQYRKEEISEERSKKMSDIDVDMEIIESDYMGCAEFVMRMLTMEEGFDFSFDDYYDDVDPSNILGA